eukprot:6192903-Pleurochrysis_carterae.AAC.2
MLAHPNFHDPLAEYVIMTDASDVAAGAVLMQWQCGPMYNDGEQPAETPLPTLDAFAAMHKARRAAGYKLVVFRYYSKTFDPTQ